MNGSKIYITIDSPILSQLKCDGHRIQAEGGVSLMQAIPPYSIDGLINSGN